MRAHLQGPFADANEHTLHQPGEAHVSGQNALVNETSPYLLQHADDPVHWLPWGSAALQLAQQKDKPILLSVGYSACHWCHVMARESFADPATAAVMNDLFVSIKVDREERPDIDKIYQAAHQLLTRRPGGWPLTMFLSPQDQAPFFGGTYFPLHSRLGMPAFRDVLEQVATFYRTNRDAIHEQNGRIRAALQELDATRPHHGNLDGQAISRNRAALGQSFDAQHGGFGQAPKFPHPSNLDRLLNHYATDRLAGGNDAQALQMVTLTLERMALGGMYDQIGGGFCRYSTDDEWMIPHFEKMLYDNGPLLSLYSRAWQLTGNALFARVARETAQWAMREMQSPEGGFYGALDADSEGQEGRFYIWQREEVRRLLTSEEYPIVAKIFGLEGPPNFEGRAWHLHSVESVEGVARTIGTGTETARCRLDSGRAKLRAARNQRIWPLRDEKILTAWNGLMIKGMVTAGALTRQRSFIESAEAALAYIEQTLWRGDRLLASSMSGQAHLPAYLDDYAFMLDAILHVLSARWQTSDLLFAQSVAEVLLDQFADESDGGFFFTANDHETLLHRSKGFMDEAMPAGNGVAARALLQLGHLLGHARYIDAAQATLRAAHQGAERYPHAHNSVLEGLQEWLVPAQLVVLRGEGEQLRYWHARCQQYFSPGRMSFAVPADADDLPGLLGARTPRGPVCAYVCEGHRCDAPIEDFATLDALLRQREVRR